MKKLSLFSVALMLAACSTATDKQVAQATLQTAETNMAAYNGDCANVQGELPSLNAVDRDEWGSAGLDLAAMDKRFAAGDDFFCHVNGLWYNNFEMPEDKTRYGSFTLLRDKSEARVKTIIEQLAAAQPDSSTLEGKVAAFYNAYLDTDAIESIGLKPAQPYLEQIASINNLNELAQIFATTGFSSPVGGWVDVDSKDTANYIFYLTQGGLGLPDRDMYLNDEGSSAKTFFDGVAQGHHPCTVPSCTATRYSAFGQKPVTRPPWGLERAGGTAGYCGAFFTVSTASCLFSSYESLSLRTISPDRPQTGDLDEHPCSGFTGARAMRLRGLLSGVTTYTANQCAAEAWKSIGFGGYGQLSEVLSEAKGQLSHVT